MSMREKNQNNPLGNRPGVKDVAGVPPEKHVVAPASPDAIRKSLGITKENIKRVERLLVVSGAYNV